MRIFTTLVLLCVISLPTDATCADLKEKTSILSVKTYAGTTTSQLQEGQLAPTMATVIEHVDSYTCHFIFFVADRPIPLRATAKKADKPDQALTFDGSVKDPRGFTIGWSATLKDDKITGSYKQPFDSGSFTLTNQYPKIAD